MKVYVSNEVSHIQPELLKRGYKIITDRENTMCDAIICNLKDGGLTNLNINNHIQGKGTLIIDLGSKSVDEIEYILNNRVYSNLF